MIKWSLLQEADKFKQKGWWDEDELFGSDEAFYSSPFSKFIQDFHNFDPNAVCWWTYFTDKRISLNSPEEKKMFQKY